VFTGRETTSQERQTAFTNMMEVALETAISL
jgi:purine-nucleoside phosphorylase